MSILRKIGKIPTVNLKNTACPECGEIQPKVRKPVNFRQALLGGSTCKKCGCEMDRFGNKIFPKRKCKL